MPTKLMLATLTDRRDFGDDWLLERKLDGERCVAHKDGDVGASRVAHRERPHGHLPRGPDALAAQPTGHCCSTARSSRSTASRPRSAGCSNASGHRSRRPRRIAAHPVVYCVFDLLEIDGEDLTRLPLVERRERLTAALRPSPALQPTEAWRGDSERRFGEACRRGWEGLIAKRADAPYARGRSKDWLKLKCVWEQELVVGGYTEPAGSRTDFGALLVGYFEDGVLRYAGKVGTGYRAETLRDLGSRLRALEMPESPFADARPVPRGTHWTRPELVAQIGFAEWTSDGRLRQPRFLGLRDDKLPADVVRERPR